MRDYGRNFLHLALAGTALLLPSLTAYAQSPGTGSSPTSKAASKWAGEYESDPPKEDGSRGAMSVSLGADGSATVTQDWGKGESTVFGHWIDSGSQITITFDADGKKPAQAPMTLAASHDGLQAVTWDHAAWGKLTPPPMKKGSGNWHKTRHSFL